jgi:hypothetical protein
MRYLAGCLAFVVFQGTILAHNENVHRRLSTAAATKSGNLEIFLRDNYVVPASSNPKTALKFKKGDKNISPSGWISDGGYDEDGGVRFTNHFYDPVANPPIGLTDTSESPWGVTGDGADSFTWAGVRGTRGNNRTWQNARDAQYYALTSPQKTERESNVADTFYFLGHIIHLIQDLSQPSHTRNDNHFSKRYIEDYGFANISRLDYNSASALDWKAAGFVRLKDFWSRGLYTGASASPLNNSSGVSTLGLAEFSNGNFVSEDSLYKENTAGVHNFPYPSLLTGTNFIAIRANMGAAIKQSNGSLGVVNRLYVSKTGEGISVTHHSAINYLGRMTISRGYGEVPSVSIGIDDDEVLKEYHSILIPKAVSYSAGVLDYFFRGKLQVRLRWNASSGNYMLDVKNLSSQPLNGGSFELYREMEDGMRSLVSWTTNPWAGTTLASNATLSGFEFQATGGTVASYTVVYKGTIGQYGDDPIDQGLAVASKRFQILRFNTTWAPYSDIDLYLVDPSGSIIYFVTKQQNSGELDIDDTYGTGPENITLNSLEDGDYQVWVNYYADHYTEDDTEEEETPTPISVTLKTYFNTSTELDTVNFTLNRQDYGGARPYDLTGPATQDSWYIRKLVKVKDGKITQH